LLHYDRRGDKTYSGARDFTKHDQTPEGMAKGLRLAAEALERAHVAGASKAASKTCGSRCSLSRSVISPEKLAPS